MEEPESDWTERRERRAKPRFAVDEGASLLLLNLGSSVSATIVELSMRGCRLRVARGVRASASTRVEVTFKVNGIAFRLAGVLQWTDGKEAVGIRFCEMPERRRVDLDELLVEIEAEAAAKAAKAAADEQNAAELEAEKLVAEKLREEKLASERLERERAIQAKRDQEKLDREKADQGKLARERAAEAKRKELQRRGGEQAASVRSVTSAPKFSRLRPAATAVPLIPSPAVEVQAEISTAEPKEAAEAAVIAKPPQQERRAQARHSVDSQATIHLVDVASRTAGRILDVSMGGCRIRTDDRFPVGIYRRVEAEFVLDGLPFRLGGVTQSLHDRRTVGIRFLDLSERKREQLMMLVEEIDEMRAEEKLRGPAPGRTEL